jgi:hypothetical protein
MGMKLEAAPGERNALESMKQATKAARGQRKGQAAQKVERLKRELDSLRQFAAGGNPKAVARQAARIARELAAAVKESGVGLGAPVTGAEDVDAKASAEARKLARQIKALVEEQRRKAKDDDEVDSQGRAASASADAIQSALAGTGAGIGLVALMPALGIDVKV